MLIFVRNSSARACCLAVTVAALLCGPVWAGDAQATFDGLFGESLRAVRATRATADDGELAAELLAAARMSGEYPELLSILCRRAYDLTADLDGGEDLAVTAMTLLANNVPAEAIEALSNVVELRRKRYETSRGLGKQLAGEQLIDGMVALADGQMAAGEAPAAMTTMASARQLANEAAPNREVRLFEAGERMNVRQEAARRAEQYRARLATDPRDRPARAALVRLELMEMDNPFAAAPYVDGSMDEFMRTYVCLAAKGPGTLSAPVAMELAAWYAHLASGADAPVAAAMLRRAVGYCERALGDEAAAVEQADQVKQLLGRVRGELARASGIPLAAGQYHELAELLDLREDVLAGRWQLLDHGVRSPATGESRLRLPVTVVGAYTLQVRLARVANAGLAAITLPVGDREVLLILDSFSLSGLELIDGERVIDNVTAEVGRRMANDRAYKLVVDVAFGDGRADITVLVDGRMLVAWQGEAESLSAPGAWSGEWAGAVVIGTAGAGWEFDSIRLRPIEPTCRRLR